MNDMLPEEQDTQFEELIMLLRQVDLTPPLIDPAEHAQIISQARARLFPIDSEVSRYEDTPTAKMRGLGSFPSKPTAGADKPHRRRRLIRLISTLAAVLVVGVLIGSGLLVFGLWSPFHRGGSGTASHIGPGGAPVVVSTQAHGLEMTMKITPGPYFISELLEVDISLVNHTKTTFQGDICHLFLDLIMIDGEGLRDTNLASAVATTINSDQLGLRIFPHDTKLASAFTTIHTPSYYPGCFPERLNFIPLQPTKTITRSYYFALTSSGHVTFAARASFLKPVREQHGSVALVPVANPLDGHWPSLQISVSPQVPSDRMLSLHHQTTQVIVDVPLAARSHILYSYNVACGSGSSGGGFGVGQEVYGNWISQSTMTLKQQCDGSTVVSWTYVVGAIGYTVLAGKYP